MHLEGIWRASRCHRVEWSENEGVVVEVQTAIGLGEHIYIVVIEVQTAIGLGEHIYIVVIEVQTAIGLGEHIYIVVVEVQTAIGLGEADMLGARGMRSSL